MLCPRRPVFSAARHRLWVLRHTFEKSGTGRSNFRIHEYGGFSAVVASPVNDKSPRMRPVGMSSDLNQVEGVKEQLFVLRKRAVFTKKNRIADAMRSFLFLNRRVLPSPTPAPLFGLIRHLPTTATFVRNEQPEVLRKRTERSELVCPFGGGRLGPAEHPVEHFTLRVANDR